MTEEFKILVAKDVRGVCTQAELATLATDLSGWIRVLNQLMRDVEVQLNAQKARISEKRAEHFREDRPRQEWLDFMATEDQWRVSAIRFMVSVQDKILYVKDLRRSQGNQQAMAA